MGIHMFPILNPPPTSLPIPFLWVIPVHQTQASCSLHQTWTGDLFLMILYMFQCHSPKSFPAPSPTESKRLSYTSVSLLLSRIQVIVTIFLNSKYMHYYTVLVFFFLVYFTLSHKPSSIHIPLLVSLLLFAKHGCKWETGKREGSRKRKKKSSLVTFLTDEDQQFFLFSHYLS